MRFAVRGKWFVMYLVSLDVQLSRPLNLLRRNSMSQQTKKDFYVTVNKEPEGIKKTDAKGKERKIKEKTRERENKCKR